MQLVAFLRPLSWLVSMHLKHDLFLFHCHLWLFCGLLISPSVLLLVVPFLSLGVALSLLTMLVVCGALLLLWI